MGAWIEILLIYGNDTWHYSRTPRWVRGLKFRLTARGGVSGLSHPTMGAWIEILIQEETMAIQQRRTPRWVRGLKY
mgnify:CR=1 FL=1